MKAGNDIHIGKFIEGVINKAIKNNVSYIHIEPFEKDIRVRFRIDGTLETVEKIPIKLKDLLISEIKTRFNLDVKERNYPQSGWLKINYSDRKVNLTVEIIPTIYGESIVIKIIDIPSYLKNLEDLGFEDEQLEDFRKAVTSPWGLIIVSGPFSSGKSFTLLTTLKELNQENVKIITVEERVEFDDYGLVQVPVNYNGFLSYDTALKSILKADSDIVMIEEINNYQIAETVFNIASTGHLVLCCLISYNASNVIRKLIDMGNRPFWVAAMVSLIINQRLVRKICEDCKEEIKVTDDTLKSLDISKEEADRFKFYHGKGCSKCNNTGYKGRTGIFEVLKVTDTIRRMILLEDMTELDIKQYAIREGMMTLRMSVIEKLKNGITTCDEVIRTISSV